jgi:hypothetical protein
MQRVLAKEVLPSKSELIPYNSKHYKKGKSQANRVRLPNSISRMAETKVSLRLLIEKKSQRVLFAEVDKKFVDFLFSIFTLPVGTVTRLLQKQNMAGCLHSLYKSIENLRDIYLQPDQDKDFLLNPKVVNISGAKVPLLLPSVEHSYSPKKFYRCEYNTPGPTAAATTTLSTWLMTREQFVLRAGDQ